VRLPGPGDDVDAVLVEREDGGFEVERRQQPLGDGAVFVVGPAAELVASVGLDAVGGDGGRAGVLWRSR
jgi:hypothetical protein